MEGQIPHVVVIGAGFGGLAVAKSLGKAPVRLTVIDRTNHHLFQPLLYQVATAGLSPAEIAAPIRSVVGKNKNTTVLLAEAARVDLAAKTVVIRTPSILGEPHEKEISYDFLVLAAGAKNSFFGHGEWERDAPGLKSLEDAVEIRRRVLLAFEAAEREDDEKERARLMTFVVIGGGPTGVELAGALSELSRHVLAEDFRRIQPKSTRVVLVEAGPRLLPAMPEELSESAAKQLQEIGVELRIGAKVAKIDDCGVEIAGDGRIDARTILWAAGVSPSPLGKTLGTPLDERGRVKVEADCSVPGHSEVFAIGDMAHLVQDGTPLPGVSPVALQQGRAVARSILYSIRGQPRSPFRYWDKGSMATIGRSRAVAETGRLRLSGFLAWVAWLAVHIWYLIGFRNRLIVLIDWAWSYLTFRRGARLITQLEWRPRG